MLTVVYKIIAKLLALRLKVLLPQLVNPQQTGFIPGRHILENVSLAWLAHDWVKATGHSALFLSLDFEKAFDRVNHEYLWNTMERLGFSALFILLVQSLLTHATSRVYVNGMFTSEIPLQRGVRQGCPLSPLVYAFATQPLMDTFEAELENGTMWGLKISNTTQLSYRFFANDLGIFIPATEQAFQAVQSLLSQYELATGAKLNMHKSVVIPMALLDTPLWLSSSGCIISSPGVVQKYLGAPFGWGLTPGQLHVFCMEKLAKRISTWATKLLTFAGRTLLITHILQGIPIYHAVFLSSTTMVVQQLTLLCREVLWGQNPMGGKRIPLVAWKTMARPKAMGGLGFKDFRAHSEALLSKWVLKALDTSDSERAQLFALNL
jgi:hypothetical protein